MLVELWKEGNVISRPSCCPFLSQARRQYRDSPGISVTYPMADPQSNSSQEQHLDPSQIDPIWASSRTARQIYALGEVEEVSLLEHIHHQALHHALTRFPANQQIVIASGHFNITSYSTSNRWTRGQSTTRRRTVRGVCAQSERVF